MAGLVPAIGRGRARSRGRFGALPDFVVAVGSGSGFGQLVGGIDGAGCASDLGGVAGGVVFVAAAAGAFELVVGGVAVFGGGFAWQAGLCFLDLSVVVEFVGDRGEGFAVLEAFWFRGAGPSGYRCSGRCRRRLQGSS